MPRPTPPSWLHRAEPGAGPDLVQGWTCDQGPDFKVPVDSPAMAVATGQLAEAAGLEGVAWTEQVHGGTVLRAENGGLVGQADALWTDTPGLGVVGRSADCPLILVAGSGPGGAGLAGFAHASWRSTVRGITGGLVQSLRKAGLRAQEARAVICPSAGPCCYEVGGEVRQEALDRLGQKAAGFFAPHGERWILDLWAANQAQLLAQGLRAENVQVAGECTICHQGSGGRQYPSYRRQGEAAGRFAGVVGIRRKTDLISSPATP
jgi:YfiH family protein